MELTRSIAQHELRGRLHLGELAVGHVLVERCDLRGVF